GQRPGIDLVGLHLPIADRLNHLRMGQHSWILLSRHQPESQYQKLVHSTTAWTGSSNVLKNFSNRVVEADNFSSRTMSALSFIATITILFACRSIPACIMGSSLD